MTELDEIIMADLDDPWVQENPRPVGGRAALGAMGGLAVAAIAAAAYSRLSRDTWRVDTLANRETRWKLLASHAVAASIGAGLAAPRGTKTASVIGTTVGVALGQLPFILDPMLLVRHPVLGNIWQYGLPIGGALFGANVVPQR